MDLQFNVVPPRTMHIDINSCFATVEQQANPRYRNKSLVVAARTELYGCILAASVDAKRQGIKTGMRVKEALLINPKLIVLPPDPDKYRHVHHSLRQLLDQYTDQVVPKSIDEFSLVIPGMTCLDGKAGPGSSLINIAHDIKRRIRTNVGDYITVSIGIGTNRFMAKTASNLHKPNGLDLIDHTNVQQIFFGLKLMDLCGIGFGNANRLNRVGITTAQEFLNASQLLLKAAFQSVVANYWHTRLRGWEIDDMSTTRKGFSQSYVLPSLLTRKAAIPVLAKLVHKLSERMREADYRPKHISLSIMTGDHRYWHTGSQLKSMPILSSDYFHLFENLIAKYPNQNIKQLAIFCDKVDQDNGMQLTFFSDEIKNEQISLAVDQINRQFGEYTLTNAAMMTAKDDVPDAIAFGRL